ncbi:acrylate utilization transcriptional regulator AcuR [Thalassotalea sp. PLHSN55]|uniref:acrylate utilization transcriptional regulator AcuR n=1 Tax=Thalassotalea sp. PLHSN55 TaxID=3435888 RepID=UPI003F861FA0
MNIEQANRLTTKPRRGRPPKVARNSEDTRSALIRSGLEVLTESGFASAGIDGILKKVAVPKGSFYHYFASKEEFGIELIRSYDKYFVKKITDSLHNENLTPLARLADFADKAQAGMAKYQFKRGCLIGNLGQEIGLLPPSFRQLLQSVFAGWQQQVEQCLLHAQQVGELSKQENCQQLAEYFWIGWEGAVMQAKLMQSSQPLALYIKVYLANLPKDC